MSYVFEIFEIIKMVCVYCKYYSYIRLEMKKAVEIFAGLGNEIIR